MRRILILTLFAAAVSAQGARTVDEILADHAAALGNAATVKTLRATGMVSVAKQKDRGIQTVWKLPGLCSREIRAPKGNYPWREFFGPDGAFISNWGLLERVRPNQYTTRGQYYLFKALAEPFPLQVYLENNAARRRLKVGSAPGKDKRYDVLFTPRDEHGVRAVYLLDPDTHHLHNVRYELEANDPIASVVYTDYVRVDGVALPRGILAYSIMYTENGRAQKFDAQKPVRQERGLAWEVNADIKGANFTAPGVPRREKPGKAFARRVIRTGPDPYELAMGDLDGDGKSDIAVACEAAVYVHFGGAEDAPVRVPLGKGHHRGMVIDDLDADGRLELVTTSNILPHRSFFVVGFSPDRKPATRRMFGAPLLTHSLRSADLDRDGIPDLIATGYRTADLQIKFGNGSGELRLIGSPWPLNVKAGTRVGLGLDIGDLDGDGMQDIAVSDGLRVVFFRGQSNLAFLPRLALPPKGEEKAQWFPYAVAMADLDRDGFDDLVVGRSNRLRDVRGGDLSVVRNVVGADGKNKLVMARPLEIGARVEAVETGHFDGDASLDIAAASVLTGELVVLFNDGAGGFAKKRMERYTSGRGAGRLAVGDHDGDGRSDIAVANRLADTIAVFTSTGGRRSAVPAQRARPVAMRAGPKFELNGLSDPFEFAGEFLLPPDIKDPSGITCLGGVVNSQFVFVSDKRSVFYRGVLDRTKNRFLIGPAIELSGLGRETLDLEGVAFDRGSGTLFLAAEQDNSVVRATIFGQVLGRAKTKIPVNPRFGIEGIVVRRKLDGTPLVYVMQELGGMVHAYDVEDPVVLTPRLTKTKVRFDQTGAATFGDGLLVLSRASSSVVAYDFDEDKGLVQRRQASFKKLTSELLGLNLPGFGVANVEGLAVDPHGDLFVLIDHNGEEIGVAGKNRARAGRLLWFRNKGKGERRAQVRQVRIKQIHIPWAGAKDAPKGLVLTKEDAAAYAREVLRRAKAGEDFDAITMERHYAHSRFARSFTIVADNMRVKRGEIRRRNLPPALVRLAFNLRLGQPGICEFHETESPYGFHILLRIE